MLCWIEVEFGFWQLNTFRHRIITFIVKPYGCLEIFRVSQRHLHTLNQTKPYGPAQPGPVSTWFQCQSVGSKLLKEQVTRENSKTNFRSRRLIMGTNELWFVTKWLDQLVLAKSETEESDLKQKKRKRSDGRSMASDSGYEEEGDGEYNISDIQRS